MRNIRKLRNKKNLKNKKKSRNKSKSKNKSRKNWSYKGREKREKLRKPKWQYRKSKNLTNKSSKVVEENLIRFPR